jgi:hypothetical protein
MFNDLYTQKRQMDIRRKKRTRNFFFYFRIGTTELFNFGAK